MKPQWMVEDEISRLLSDICEYEANAEYYRSINNDEQADFYLKQVTNIEYKIQALEWVLK